MQSKKKQSKRARAVYRAIGKSAVVETTPVQQKAADAAQNPPSSSLEQQEPAGDVASATATASTAVRAAAIDQLNQYAAYIEQFLEESRMRTIVNRLQAEVAPPTMEEQNYLRLRRD